MKQHSDLGKQAWQKPVGRVSLLLAPGVAWLAAFMLVPVLFMFVVSFWSSGYYGTQPDFTFKSYLKIFQSPLYVGQLVKTLRIGLEATVLSLLVSYPVAYLITRASGTRTNSRARQPLTSMG